MRPLLVWALAATAAGGAEHRVRNPEALARALDQARPGDHVVLAAGTWRDADLLVEAAGTEEATVTVRAEAPGRTILAGRSRLRLAGSHVTVSGLVFRNAWHEEDLVQFRRDAKRPASDCRLTDCVLEDCNAPRDRARETRWIGIYGSRHRIDHCRIEGKTTKGATVVVWLDASPEPEDGPPAHRIDHNIFGPRPRLGENGGETLRIGDSKTSRTLAGVTVEANAFEACDGEAEIISNKSCGNVYRGNVFTRCSGALTLRHGDDCVVEGNVFLGHGAAGTGGVRVVGEGHRVVGNHFADLAGTDQRAGLCVMNGLRDSPLNGYARVRNLLVSGNTWMNCRQPIRFGLTDEDAGNDLAPESVTFAGNRFAGPHPVLAPPEARSMAGVDWRGDNETTDSPSEDFRPAAAPPDRGNLGPSHGDAEER
jgi:poly(beta-D-mannuronate) lyase